MGVGWTCLSQVVCGGMACVGRGIDVCGHLAITGHCEAGSMDERMGRRCSHANVVAHVVHPEGPAHEVCDAGNVRDKDSMQGKDSVEVAEVA